MKEEEDGSQEKVGKKKQEKKRRWKKTGRSDMREVKGLRALSFQAVQS